MPGAAALWRPHPRGAGGQHGDGRVQAGLRAGGARGDAGADDARPSTSTACRRRRTWPAPLLIVNGPVAREIGMNGGVNAFGSGNRANATIGRAIRLDPAQCRRRQARRPRQDRPSATPANTPIASPRTRPRARSRPTMSRRGSPPTTPRCSSSPPSRRTACTNHVADDPEGILDTHLLGDEHDRQQQRGVERPLRRRHRPGARPHDRRQRLDPARHPQLSGT